MASQQQQKPRRRARRAARRMALVMAAGVALLVAPAPQPPGGGRGVALVGPATALDMDLRQPLFTRRTPASRPPQYRRAPAYEPPRQRGFLETLFGGGRAQQPAAPPAYRRRERAEPPRRVRAAPRPAPVRPQVTRTEFVYLIAAPGPSRLAEGLEAAFADRPIVGVRPLRAPRETPADAAALLAPLPAELAGQGQEAVVVIEARPEWARLDGERLRALVEDAAARLQARGAPVVWVGLPPVPSAEAPARAATVNGALKAAAQKTGGGFADAWAAFADDDGRFTAWGPTVTGETARLREDGDGALTRAGARKLAHFIALEARRLLAARHAPPSPAIADPFALPGPPPPPVATAAPDGAGEKPPERPAVGPVLPLGRLQATPGARLVSQGADAMRDADGLARRALGEGIPPPPAPGRADDFRWPRGGG
ncbi:hypothetical protein ACFFJB_11630 [Camelimonas abortus]|uniref:DUF459 domain-containing protein n=1 Tax=Camelimonas abortus TaxID=1017184 RepID=A0ABV7LE67_9HYPH